jgi:hypothetical protein
MPSFWAWAKYIRSHFVARNSAFQHTFHMRTAVSGNALFRPLVDGLRGDRPNAACVWIRRGAELTRERGSRDVLQNKINAHGCA